MIVEFNNKKYFVFTSPLEFDNYLVKIEDNYYNVDYCVITNNPKLNKLTTIDVLRYQKHSCIKILQSYEVTAEEETKLKNYKLQDCLLSDIESIKYIQL